MYLCTHVSMYVCRNECIYVLIYGGLKVYAYLLMYVRKYICMNVCFYVNMYL